MSDWRSFTETQVDSMCRALGFGRSELHEALRRIGPAGLRRDLQPDWTEARPTRGYCYRVVEAVVCSHLVPEGFTTFRAADRDGTHWFLRNESTGEILDPTADQFEAGYDYGAGRPRRLFPQMSWGAKRIIEEIGLLHSPSPRAGAERARIAQRKT